jgi:hypothetical protein
MYRARWASNDDAAKNEGVKKERKDLNTRDIVATVAGASCGVGLMAGLGAFKSIALTPLSLALLNDAWSFGGAYDISKFTDMTSEWVATTNTVFLPALGVAFDFVVLTSIVALIVLKAQEMLAAAPTNSDELCLLTQAVEPVCGPTSFDSSEEFACVEQWADGRMRWVCA